MLEAQQIIDLIEEDSQFTDRNAPKRYAISYVAPNGTRGFAVVTASCPALAIEELMTIHSKRQRLSGQGSSSEMTYKLRAKERPSPFKYGDPIKLTKKGVTPELRAELLGLNGKAV